jgi:ABC-type multidrug transport system ATPase subunit
MANAFGHQTILAPHPYLELNNKGNLVRFSLTQPVHTLGRDSHWADLNVPIDWIVVSSRHAILRKEGRNYRIFDGDETNKPSTNGLWRDRVRIKPNESCLLEHGVQLEIGQDPNNYLTLTYLNPVPGQLPFKPTKSRLSLQGLTEWPVKIGREINSSYASMQLDAPTVSRLHALVNYDAKVGYFLEDANSNNGTFVNKRRIDRAVLLNEGDIIQIGPFTLIFRQETLEIFDRGDRLRLDAYDLLRKVREPRGGERIILNNVSIAIEPGQLVALVGSSGAGKSTLLKTLLGIQPLNSGMVFLNGDNLRQHFDIYRSHIGYVPQDDIVHTHLTVTEVLTYACLLRLPPKSPIGQIVEKTIQQVKLDFVKNSFVSQLSGGQRKRVSIAVELLADPKLFFLDEPTSGLDPGLDKEMMLLLRELANQGRTIILVTHATSNIEECDRVAFMGRGGRLCYFGPPQEALDFFQMPSRDWKYFADIYIKLEQGQTAQEVETNVQAWADRFYNNSQAYQNYIRSALIPTPTQRSQRQKNKQKRISLWQQLWLLSRRYLLLVSRDLLSLYLSLLVAPLGVGLIALALSGDNPLVSSDPPKLTQASQALRVLFIFTCASIIVGLLSSVQEIVKESTIYARERLVNLGTFAYLGSKLLVRSGLAILQTALMTALVLLVFKSPQPIILPWWLGLSITSFLTILATICLGLAVSSFVKNENEANNNVALILLFQIVLSGVLFKLEGLSSKLSWLTISRWSVGAYGSLVNVNGMVPNPGQNSDNLPFQPSAVYEPTWSNLRLNWLVLGIHILVYLLFTFCQQKSKDKKY